MTEGGNSSRSHTGRQTARKADTLRRRFQAGTVGAAVSVLAGTASTAAASSGADALWDTFAARCLIPFENVVAADVSGLQRAEPVPEWLSLAQNARAWRLDSAHAALVTDGDIDSELATCSIAVAAPLDGLAKQFDGWTDKAVASGRYARIEARRLESTEWREPRLHVVYEPGTGSVGPVIRVIEVNLEA